MMESNVEIFAADVHDSSVSSLVGKAVTSSSNVGSHVSDVGAAIELSSVGWMRTASSFLCGDLSGSAVMSDVDFASFWE